MSFFSRVTISRLFAPRHKLSCSWFLWRRLKAALRDRGRNCSRESGAFLLGNRKHGIAHIVDFVLYDDLDPYALDTGIVRFDGRYFGDLWAICKASGLTVVADVHVHPGSSDQSDSDRNHPMISRAGHIALIVPSFGSGSQSRRDIGVYCYLGAKQWMTVPTSERSRFFRFRFV
jgi:proteasome lid subunit RPN8/RPN11